MSVSAEQVATKEMVVQSPLPAFSLKTTTSNDAPFWPGFRLAVLGAPGVGKTHLAMSASATYPSTWPADEPCTIDDVYVVETDEAGLGPAREAGVLVKNVLDLSGASVNDVYKLIKTLPRFLESELKARPEVRVLCLDHASGFFDAVHLAISAKTTGVKIYSDLAKDTRDFMFDMKARIHIPVIYNFHIKRPQLHVDGMAEAAAIAQTVAANIGREQGDYAMAGKGASDVIRNAVTLSAHLTVTRQPNGKDLRELLFVDSQVFTKRRLTLCVGEKEPANLRKLFEKIGAGVQQPW